MIFLTILGIVFVVFNVILGLINSENLEPSDLKKNYYRFNPLYRWSVQLGWQLGKAFRIIHRWGQSGGDSAPKEDDWMKIDRLQRELKKLNKENMELKEKIVELHFTGDINDVHSSKTR